MTHWIDQIDALMRDGGTLADAEAYLEHLPLNEDQKSALWLYAWGMLPREELRREVAAIAEFVSA